MTIEGWIIFGVIALVICFIGGAVILDASRRRTQIIGAIVCIALIAAVLSGMLWYFNNTASGQRKLIDQKSDLTGGIERTITVYTADGEVIAQYQGKIDLEVNDGGYVKFDFEGKRYIYYNCFVETIADISGDSNEQQLH